MMIFLSRQNADEMSLRVPPSKSRSERGVLFKCSSFSHRWRAGGIRAKEMKGTHYRGQAKEENFKCWATDVCLKKAKTTLF